MLEFCLQPQISHLERLIMLRLIYERHTPLSNGAILIEPVKRITDYLQLTFSTRCASQLSGTLSLLDNIFI